MTAYLPTLDPADFSNSTAIDNPYFPLPAGAISSFIRSMVDPESGETDTERTNIFEIATDIGVTGFADIEVMQLGNAAVLSFAGGWEKIDRFDADLIGPSDFDFVQRGKLGAGGSRSVRGRN